MDLGLQEVLMVAGALAVVAVLVHGLLAMRRNNNMRIKLDQSFIDTKHNDPEVSDLMLLRAELPNGGARVVFSGEADAAQVADEEAAPAPRSQVERSRAPRADASEPVTTARVSTAAVSVETASAGTAEMDAPDTGSDQAAYTGATFPETAGAASTAGAQAPMSVTSETPGDPGNSLDRGIPVLVESVTMATEADDEGIVAPVRVRLPDTAARNIASEADRAGAPHTAVADPSAVGVPATQGNLHAEITPLEVVPDAASVTTEPVSDESAAEGVQTVETEPETPRAPSDLRPVVLTVLARDGMFAGAALRQMLDSLDMTWGDMQIFHRLDARGDVEFSLANAVEPGTFEMDTMDQMETPGVTLFMLADELTDPGSTYENMLMVAQMLADELGGSVKDERRDELTAQSIESRRDILRGYGLRQA